MGRMINTDAAYAVLTDYYHHSTDTQHQALREALGRVESVDAVPVKHGRWIEDPVDDWGCRCSECGQLELYQSDYCPSCGAKMDRKDGDGNE